MGVLRTKAEASQNSAQPPIRRTAEMLSEVIHSGMRALVNDTLTPQKMVATSMQALPVMNLPAPCALRVNGVFMYIKQ